MEPEDHPTAATAGRQVLTLRGSRLVLVAFVLVALVPILGAALRLHHAGWVPEGDDAMIARRTMAVFSHHPPITGQPSTAGGLFIDHGSHAHAASIEASHAGPLEYYLLALPYRLSGWSPAGLLAAVALVDGAAAVAAVWLAWRRLGSAGAAAATIAVLAVAAHLGTWNLARPLNANIAVLPLLAGLIATWSVLDGDPVAVVVAAASFSLVVQAHLGAAPLGAAALLVALGSAAWQWRRRWKLLAGTGAVLAAAWALVALQQAVGHPGNLSQLVEVARLPVDRAGPAFGIAAVFDHVTQPAWPGVPPLPRISILGPIAVAPAIAKGLVLLALLGGVARWAWRAGRATIVRLVAVVVGAIAVPMVVLARGPDEVRLGPSYQLTSLVAVGGLATMVLAVAVLDPLRRWPAASTRIPLVATSAIAALGLAGVAVTVLGGPTYPADAARTRAIADGIRHQVRPGRYRLSASGTWAYLSTLDAVSVELLRHGYDIRVVRLGATPDEPIRRKTDIDAPTIHLDSTDETDPNGRLLVSEGPLPADPTWAGPLLRAVSRPTTHLAVRGRAPTGSGACAADVVRLARGPDSPTRRRHVVRAVLRCSQGDRRAAGSALRWSGIQPFWVDLLGSNMPGPYPHTGLSASLEPAPAP